MVTTWETVLGGGWDLHLSTAFFRYDTLTSSGASQTWAAAAQQVLWQWSPRPRDHTADCTRLSSQQLRLLEPSWRKYSRKEKTVYCILIFLFPPDTWNHHCVSWGLLKPWHLKNRYVVLKVACISQDRDISQDEIATSRKTLPIPSPYCFLICYFAVSYLV